MAVEMASTTRLRDNDIPYTRGSKMYGVVVTIVRSSHVGTVADSEFQLRELLGIN